MILFRKANKADAENVLSLYRSAVGGEFCTWNEYYPTETEVDYDLSADSLFVLEEDGRIIGAGSIVPENELDGSSVWEEDNAGEIARIVVSPECRGRGLSAVIVEGLTKRLRENGRSAVHLSVAVKNIPARRTYEKLGFEIKDKCQIYGNDYYLSEKIFKEKTNA